MVVARRLVSAVLALALVAGGLVVATEIVLAAFGRPPSLLPYDRWYASARETSWDAASARWLFAALAAGGLALIGLNLVRSRPAVLGLESGDGRSPADVDRRSVERSLVRAATAVHGVSRARARVSARRAEVTASTDRSQVDALRPRLVETVDGRLRTLGLASPPHASVRLRSRTRR